MKNKGFRLLNYLFLVVFFLLFLFAVKPSLIYFFQQNGFSSTKSFFSNYTSFPGGIAEYLSLFLFQFYSKAFLGAVLTTLLLYTISKISDTIINKGDKIFNGFLRLSPAVFLGILLTDYSLDPIFPLLIFFLFGFFFLFKLISDKALNIYIRLALTSILLCVAYYIVGGFVFFVLSASALLYLFFVHKNELKYLGSLILALALFIPFLAQKIFFININDAYFRLIPYFGSYKPGFLLYAAIFSLPIIILIQNAILKFKKKSAEEEKGFLFSEKFLNIQLFIMISALIIGMIVSIDGDQRHKLKVNYLAHQQKWEKLLKVVEKRPSDNRIIQFQTTRALYHTGELSEKMFNYPQIWGVDGLVLSRYFEPDILLPSTEFYFELGFINEAIHFANEAISLHEFSPVLIEQLILANIVSNKYDAAKIYINLLKTIPFNKRKAESYDRFLKNGDDSTINDIVRRKRSIMPVTDFRINKMFPQDDLLNILNDRPDNKMAYEYLMAFYLLNNDLYSFSEHYKLGKKMNYKKMPTIFQEALVLLAYDLRTKGQTVGNQYFDQGIVSQFNEYLSVLKQFNGDKDLAKSTLEKQFANTYWYYILYNSPVTNKSKIVNE